MTYKFRVTLSGIKGFFRVYHVNADNTLYTFHKQLRSDLEFPQDQPILFKALDEAGDVVARWALIDLGSGTVDKIKIAEAVKKGVTSFVYFYDIASKKNVIITLEGPVDEQSSSPVLVDSKGPVPLEFENGYVAFEDLPKDKRRGIPGLSEGDSGNEEDDDDDDDEDEDNDEDKDEDGELIYDENE